MLRSKSLRERFPLLEELLSSVVPIHLDAHARKGHQVVSGNTPSGVSAKDVVPIGPLRVN